MSKGLNPQDVADALLGDFRFVAMDSNGEWYMYEDRPYSGSDRFKGHDACELNIQIDFTGRWQDSVFEKQEELEDGELVLAVFLNTHIYEPARYQKSLTVYSASEKTGNPVGGFRVDKIIKYKGNESLLGTEVK